MRNSLQIWLLTAATIISPALAQTSTSCDPTKRDGCPVDTALASSVTYDFTKGASPDWRFTGPSPSYDANGANFVATSATTAITLESSWYAMFGYFEVTLKAAKGAGIISAITLLSDDLDEIDWELVGPDGNNAQANYFGKGCACGYGRGSTHPAVNAQNQFHTYKIEWKADQITWWIDDDKAHGRVLKQADAAKGQWPQTPSRLKIGIWSSLDANAWSGGPATFKDGPNAMVVKSVKAMDYSTGKSYSYGDKSGTWQSIKSDGGVINPNGNSNVTPGKQGQNGASSSSSSSVSSTSQTSSSSSVSTTVSSSSVSTSAATSASSSQSSSQSSSATDTTASTSSGSATGTESSASSTASTTDSTALTTASTTDSASVTATASASETVITYTSDSSVFTSTSTFSTVSYSNATATDSATSCTETITSCTESKTDAQPTETVKTITTDSTVITTTEPITASSTSGSESSSSSGSDASSTSSGFTTVTSETSSEGSTATSSSTSSAPSSSTTSIATGAASSLRLKESTAGFAAIVMAAALFI